MSSTINLIKSLSIQDSATTESMRRTLSARPEPLAMGLSFIKAVGAGALYGKLDLSGRDGVLQIWAATWHFGYATAKWDRHHRMPLRRAYDQPINDDRIIIADSFWWSEDPVLQSALDAARKMRDEFCAEFSSKDSICVVQLLTRLGLSDHLMLTPSALSRLALVDLIASRRPDQVAPIDAQSLSLHPADLPYYSPEMISEAFRACGHELSDQQAQQAADQMNFQWSFEATGPYLLEEIISERPADTQQWSRTCRDAWRSMVHLSRTGQFLDFRQRLAIDARHAELLAERVPKSMYEVGTRI